MARIIEAFEQFFDNAGAPLNAGTVEFFKSGTSSPLTTFADSLMTIPNTNPLVLAASGRTQVLGVFAAGSAKAILRDSTGGQIREVDPIGAENVTGDFALFDPLIIYNINDIVEGSDGKFYISLTNSNSANDPTAPSPSDWSEFRLIGVYNTSKSYSVGDVVQESTGNLWKSLTNSNLGNTPSTDAGTNWVPAIDGSKLTEITALETRTTNLEAEFDQIAFSETDNPILHLFKKNKIVEATNGNLSVSRSTLATSADINGIVETSAIDIPREEGLGWLFEGQSTNLALRSEEFDNASWAKTSTSVTPNTTIAPDGLTTADSLIELSGTSEHFLSQTITISGSNQASAFYVKSLSGNRSLRIRLGDENGLVGDAFYNLSTALTYSVSTGIDAKMEPLSGGWFRCSAAAKAFTGVAALARPYLVVEGTTTTNYNGDGASGLIIWGGQFESQPFVSSYIKTVATSVIRNADNYLSPIPANIPNPDRDWSIFLRVRMLAVALGSGLGQQILEINTGTTLEHSLIQLGGNNIIIYRLSGGTITDATLTNILANTDYNIAITHNSSTRALTIYKNGDEEINSNTVTDYPTLNPTGNIFIGNDILGNAKSANMNLLDLRIYDFTLTANQVKFLSGV